MIDVLPGAARLVVGVSGSPASLHALRYARLAAASSGAQIAAVHAWVPPGGDLAERRCPSAALRRAWAAAAGTRLTDAIDAAWGGLPPDLDVELVIIRAEPGPALVQVADSARDLLVVGAGQRGALRRMWRGKVSRYCLAHAQCPVLALPQPATPREMGIGRGGWLLHRRELTLDQALRDWGTAA